MMFFICYQSTSEKVQNSSQTAIITDYYDLWYFWYSREDPPCQKATSGPM